MYFRVVLLLGAVFIGKVLSGQYFNARYDGFQNGRAQTAWGIKHNPSGYTVFSVSSERDSLTPDSSFYYQALVLTFLNANGVLLSEKKIIRPQHSTYAGWSNCCDTIAGGFVVGAGTQSIDLDAEIYLIRFDANGDTLWTRVYGDSTLVDYWIGRQVKHTADGGFLIVGDTDATGYVDGFALKTDSLGNEQWRQTYGSGLLDAFSAGDRCGAGYVLGGERFLNTDNSQFWVQRIDAVGNVIWSTVWGGPYREPAAHLITLLNGDIAVFGTWGDTINYVGTPYIAILDSSDGSIIWDQRYGASAYATLFFAGKETLGGDLIACGATYVDGPRGGLLLRTNNQGDSLWMRTYYFEDSVINTGQGIFFDVLPTADGGFIAAGAAYNPYNAGYPPGYSQDTWVVKVDSLGCIIPGCDGVGVQEVLTNFTDALRVWPNPVASGGSLSVQLELPAWFAPNGGLHLTLTNALGQVVQQETMATSTFTIQTGGLAPGLYHLHISDATRWISGTAVVVE